MSDVPGDLLYTKEHEWCRFGGGKVRVGITAHAAKELGDVVFVELPAVGSDTKQNQPFGAVESVKAVSDLFAPLSGKVVARNDALEGAPETVNADPYGDGWMIEIEFSNEGEKKGLLDAAAYQALIAK